MPKIRSGFERHTAKTIVVEADFHKLLAVRAPLTTFSRLLSERLGYAGVANPPSS